MKFISIFLLFLFASMLYAQVPPQFPSTFYGIITSDGGSLENQTLNASIGAISKQSIVHSSNTYSCTPSQCNYFITITKESQYASNEVIFSINGYELITKGNYSSGTITRLDLIAPASAVPTITTTTQSSTSSSSSGSSSSGGSSGGGSRSSYIASAPAIVQTTESTEPVHVQEIETPKIIQQTPVVQPIVQPEQTQHKTSAIILEPPTTQTPVQEKKQSIFQTANALLENNPNNLLIAIAILAFVGFAGVILAVALLAIFYFRKKGN
ncbi:MAG: hypothetical protein WC492_04955 [Candidatus Micrarchaeia archaeon]